MSAKEAASFSQGRYGRTIINWFSNNDDTIDFFLIFFPIVLVWILYGYGITSVTFFLLFLFLFFSRHKIEDKQQEV